MDLGNSVGTVRADNGQVGHADMFGGTFFDQTDPLDFPLVAGKAVPDVIE